MTPTNEEPAKTNHELGTPTYRASVRNGRLSLTDWDPVLLSQTMLNAGIPGLSERQATIVDLIIVGEEEDELIAVLSDQRDEVKTAVQVLLAWAGFVGYRRIWLPDRVVNIEPSPDQIGVATLTCPTCLSEFSAEGPDFWLGIRKAKSFPKFCLACGCEAPQWDVASPDASATSSNLASATSGS